MYTVDEPTGYQLAMNPDNIQITVIIPTLNEEGTIGETLQHLKQKSTPKNIREILVVDGGSTDNTCLLAEQFGARVVVSKKGRAAQMNLGAREAQGALLYFLHADTLPPQHYDRSILQAVDAKHRAGCFQMRFDSRSLFLKFFAWFSRVNLKVCRGGDQSLFITRRLFEDLDGFNEDYRIYEDNEFIGRLYDHTRFKILPEQVKTSARRYEKHGKLRLQYHFGVIHLKKSLGAGPEQLYRYYSEHIR